MTASTMASPAIPATVLARLRWALADGWTIARRELIHRWIHQPGAILAELLWPGSMVLLFGFVFGSAMVVPGGGNYREFLMPGLFGMTMMMGIGTTVTAVTNDASLGITDRFRAMPMARSGVVLGRSLADIGNSVIGLLTLVGFGLLVGWRWHGSLAAALAAMGLLLLLRFAMIWVGIYLGLLVKTPEGAAMVWMPLFPLTMIANTFVSPASMPGWLAPVAAWNPLSATVGAARELFGNPGVGVEDTWIAGHPVLMAVVWPVLIVMVFLPLAVYRYHALSR